MRVTALCSAAVFAVALSAAAQTAPLPGPGAALPPQPFGMPPSVDGPAGFSGKLLALRQEEQAKRELKTLAAAYTRSLDQAKRQELADKLRVKLEATLKRELERDKEAVASLERQLEQAKKRLAKRAANQDKMLELKMNELLADSDLSW